MQFVNDDMDELFRKAADNYPLKTDNADWNKVLQGLQSKGDGPDEPGNKRTNYRKYLWLLLLLPLAFVCNKYAGNNKDGNKETVSNTSAQTQPGKTEKNSTTQEQTTGKGDESVSVPSSEKGKEIKKNTDKTTAYNRPPADGNVYFSSAPATKSANADNLYSNGNTANDNKNNIAGEDSKTQTVTSSLPALTDKGNTETTNTTQAGNVDVAENKVTANTDDKKDTSTTIAKEAIKVKKEKQKLKKGFYLGILGGPDVSTVKLQEVQKVGYSIGLIGGYRITGNFGVEVGVLWDKKQYYTDGDHFNTSKIYLPPNVAIKDVAGNCTMIEIPVAGRYDFGIKKNSNFFTTLGMSSYLMSKEKYDYMYDHNNNLYGVHREYNSTSKSWFSVIHASVGYEKNIGVIGNLRVEPYLKIPVAGVGIGSLPISSVGMYIGVTKHF